jgi:hypothetical protein
MEVRRVAQLAFAGLLLIALQTSDARADLDRNIRQLRNSDNFKVRLSAALSLAKSRSPRAVAALATTLARDSSSTLRRVAVDSLSKILKRPLPRTAMRIGLTALERASSRDRNASVRRAASQAHAALTRRQRQSGGGAFVALGKPSDPKRVGPRGLRAEMLTMVSRTVKRGAPSYDVYLRAKSPRRSRGWFIGASIAEISISRSGRSAEVRCRVAVRVSPYLNGQERFIAGESASAKGAGRVVGGSSRSALDRSARDCVLAVVEQVTERQVVPFIKRAAGERVAEN